MIATHKRILSSLAVATMMTTVSKAAFPNLSELWKGHESKQYYRGTTQDIVAVIEVISDSSIFFVDMNFWTSFIVAMQVDNSNYYSDCVTEI